MSKGKGRKKRKWTPELSKKTDEIIDEPGSYKEVLSMNYILGRLAEEIGIVFKRSTIQSIIKRHELLSAAEELELTTLGDDVE